MFGVILLFTIGMAIPLVLMLWEGTTAHWGEIGLVAGGLLLAMILLLILVRRPPRTEARRPKPPNPKTVASLKWPADLTNEQFETYCAAYLRQTGWTVAVAQSNEAHGVYLDATRTLPDGAAARALLLCENRGELVTPMLVRTLAFANTAFEGAKAVALVDGRVTPAAGQAAAAAGVAIIPVAGLPKLADAAGRTAPAAPEPQPEAATPPPP